jgi:circadian clock protein KaiB
MSRSSKYKFRLFIAAETVNSIQAVANLNAICRSHLEGRHEIEVVDVWRDPQRALTEGVRMTPTLVKLAPLPMRRIVGTLSQTQRVLEVLGLDASAA